MPPKAKFSREEILLCAFETVRKYGVEHLSARSLAAALGCSTAPIFTAFQSIEELILAVCDKAKALYGSYLEEGMKGALPFHGSGMAYVRFAKEEPKLFALLFMGDGKGEEPSHYFPSDGHSGEILQLVMSRYGLSEEKAKSLFNHLSVYAHGLATLFARGRCVFTMEDVSDQLSEVFRSLIKELGSV